MSDGGNPSLPSSTPASDKGKRWFPLGKTPYSKHHLNVPLESVQSNPEVMNTYVSKMGWPTGSYRFTDVYSTEDWALAMVPQPVLAVVMLFPIKESSERHRAEEQGRLQGAVQARDSKPYFMKQTVGNACGTVGLLHATINASMSKGITLDEDCFLKRFWMKTNESTPAEIAQILHDEQELEAVHEEAAQQGQSEQIARDEKVITHFVCLTDVGGMLYELDGRKEAPVPHGPTTPDTLLKEACAVVKQFMDRDPGELR